MGWRRQPEVDLLARRQDRRHRLRVDRASDLIRLGGQKREDIVVRLTFLQLSDGGPAFPNSRKKNASGLGWWSANQTGGFEPFGSVSFLEKLVTSSPA